MKILLFGLWCFSILQSCSQYPKRDSDYFIKKAATILKRVEIERKSEADEKYDSVLNYIDSAIAINPKNVDAYTFKISVLQAMKNDSLALLTLREVINMKVDFAESYVLVGTIFNRKHMQDSAIKYYNIAIEKYLKRPPSDSRNLNLIMTYFMLTGDRDSALSHRSAYPIKDSLINAILLESLEKTDK